MSTLLTLRTQLLGEVRQAQAGLSAGTLAAKARYDNAIYELERLQRLIHRMELEPQQVDSPAY